MGPVPVGYHARVTGAFPCIRLAVTLLVALFLSLGFVPLTSYADPVVTVMRGVEPDGSERLLDDLAMLWRASAAYDGSWLAVKSMADPRSRLRAVRFSRAQFAVVDAGDFAALRSEYPDLVVLSALTPVTIHALMRADAGALRAVPGTIVYTGHARFAAQALAELGRGSAPVQPAGSGTSSNPANLSAPGPVLRAIDPRGAVELLRRGLSSDTLLLLAAPLGTEEIATALKGDSSLHLMNLAPPLVGALRRDRAWVLNQTVARGYYPNQSDAVEAPAVYLLLVTLPVLSQDNARRMLECLYGRHEQMSGVDSLFASADRRINSEVARWAPYHATAMKEFGLTP